MTRLRTAIITGAVAVGALAGCSNDSNEGEQPWPDPIPEVTESEEPTQEPTGGTDGPTDDPLGPTEVPTDVPTEEPDVREELRNEATVTFTCLNNGQDVLAEDGATVIIEGHCEDLLIDMSDGTVIAERIFSLQIIGDNNIVYTDEVANLLIEGQGNSVFWLFGEPNIEHDGVDSTLEQR